MSNLNRSDVSRRQKVNNFSTASTTLAPIKYNISKLVDIGVLYALYQSMLLYC